MKLKIAVCEDIDEHYKHTYELLEGILKGQNSFTCTRFSSGTEFAESLLRKGCPYDIVLMDIDLGEDSISGIETARKINALHAGTQIIFISQYLEYATSVYETDHIYFITKNQLEEYLPRAIMAAVRKLEEKNAECLYFSRGSQEFRVPKCEIIYLEHNLHTTMIHTVGDVYSTREKLQKLVEQLGEDFCLCHKSFAVNLHMVRSCSRDGILLTDGTQVPVSRSRYEATKDALAFMKISQHKELL